mmetsp:Transcript_13599/g.38958  ORF Transcript_13599/g.38958 Transcript_13599/m.38958 type:complete len:300 (+) Transcript_13599:1685-2584(+)
MSEAFNTEQIRVHLVICLALLLLCPGQGIEGLGRWVVDVGRYVGHVAGLMITDGPLIELVRQHWDPVLADEGCSSDGICARLDLGNLIFGRRGNVGLRRTDHNGMSGMIPLIPQRKVWIIVRTILNPHDLQVGQGVGKVTEGRATDLGSSKRMAVNRHHGEEGRISRRSYRTEGATEGMTAEYDVAEGVGRRQFIEKCKYLLLEGIGKVTVSERWVHKDCMRRMEDAWFPICILLPNVTLHWLGLLFGSALVADKELTVLLATKHSHCHSTALLSIVLREDRSLSMLEGWDGEPFVLFS